MTQFDRPGAGAGNRLRRLAIASLMTAPIAMLAGCDAPAAQATANAADDGVAAGAPAATVAAAPAPSPTPAPTGAAATATGLPADVVAFKTRRDACDHFRGEEAGDDARAAELERQLEQNCTGTDAALAALRKRHAGNAAATAALADYDDAVE